ncbi:hypothetical protein C8R46DRAFT_1352579 [Mycena filopes]|nr:hypothetical protein C8R46DRAFT_1352579 [Mycena filopes]
MKNAKKREGPQKHTNPHLPRSVWERFKKDHPDSLIFTPYFGQFRQGILTSKDLAESLPNGLENFYPLLFTPTSAATTAIAGGNWLHLAVTQADLPMAHECLRLGVSTHLKDRRGHSPLYFACSIVKDNLHPDGPVHGIFRGHAHTATSGFAFVAKNIQICLLLLQHHADPNETHDGLSLLALATLSDQWDLIEALLCHGAVPFPSSPTQPPIRFLKTEDAKRSFTATVSQLSGKPRPRRLCPGGSTRPLVECHATPEPKPYPDEALCPCAGGKTHGLCCAKRKDMNWMEQWDPSEERLERVCIPRLSGALREAFDSEPDFSAMQVGAEFLSAANKEHRFRFLVAQLDLAHRILKKLGESGRIDPAYAWAGCQVSFVPLSEAGVRTMSKVELNNSVRIWNENVDKYIRTKPKVDRRTRESIENASKVGPAGGPLHRRCEAVGCPKVEDRDGVKLFRCGGCSKAVYCSSSCQKLNWYAHKSKCRSGDAKSQLLPSQIEFLGEMNTELSKKLSRMLDRAEPDLPTGLMSMEAMTAAFLEED